jgi:hypothetical protein
VQERLPRDANEAVRIRVVERCNIEEIYIVPTIDSMVQDESNPENENRYVTRRAYYMGQGLPSNKAYSFIAYATTDPRDQSTVLVIMNAQPMESDLDMFEVDEDTHIKLVELFQTDSPYDKLVDIAEDHAIHTTHIYGRPDLHIMIDLSYHSILQFSLDGIELVKGWVELLVVGDTRTGKGYVAENLRKFYNAGDIISGENLTSAGLVGGLHKLGDHWSLVWGKIPLQDRRLVILDECGGLSTMDIAKLSRVRSEGIAEITKIVTEKTWARTRLIWLGNPRAGRTGTSASISDYNYGVECVTDLIGTMEDIARFDAVLIVAKNEVDNDLINKSHPIETPRKYPRELCQAVLMWAWSRKSDQVKWHENAEKLLYKMSISLAQQFTSRIPLIQGEDIRYKLGRIATAIAARTYSTEDGMTLEVMDKHVTCAYNVLFNIYSKSCCGYLHMSETELERERFEHATEVKNLIMQNIPNKGTLYTFIEGMLNTRALSLADIIDYTDWDVFQAKSIISQLLKYMALRKQNAFYLKQDAFILFLREWKNDLIQAKHSSMVKDSLQYSDTLDVEVEPETLMIESDVNVVSE